MSVVQKPVKDLKVGDVWAPSPPNERRYVGRIEVHLDGQVCVRLDTKKKQAKLGTMYRDNAVVSILEEVR